MRRTANAIALGVFVMAGATCAAPQDARGPLRVCEENPRYFADPSGQAVLLVGSHVWNSLQDMGRSDPPEPFDWDAYLDFLDRHNHNFIRLWRWELLTTAGLLVCPSHPWPRTGPGEALDGKPRFDLEQFDEAFFHRIRQRCVSAGQRGMYVSVMLFEGWGLQRIKGASEAHPFHPDNNANDINGGGLAIHELGNARVTELQEAYVRKVIDTVNDLDNVLYEISNENHPASTDWQYHMIRFIKQYEADKPKQHPVGMTFQFQGGSNSTLFDSPADWVSPGAKGGYKDNPRPADGSKVIITDTDHLWGVGGDQAWVWKSFCSGMNPIFMDPYDGVVHRDPFDPQYDPIRKGMGQALALSRMLNLARCVPSRKLASSRYCLADPGSEYVAYLPDGGSVTLDLSAAQGTLAVKWLNPDTGEWTEAGEASGGGEVELEAPFEGDAVLLVQKQQQAAH